MASSGHRELPRCGAGLNHSHDVLGALGDPHLAAILRLRPTVDGQPFAQPSILFTTALFDTEHERHPALAPTHGHIRVSHFFLRFGYPTSTQQPKKPKKT